MANVSTTLEDERWCTTPFSTRTIKLNAVHEMVLGTMDFTILVLNLVSSLITMHIVKTTQMFRRKRCLWLIYHLCLNDIIFAVITQTLYAVKLFRSELACYYDLIFSFISLSLGNTSLALVLAISILRYCCTKYLLQMNFILTKRRSWYIFMAAIMFGFIITSLVIVGSIINDVYLIHIPAALTDILVPTLIPVLYRKAARVAKNRRCGSYFHKIKSTAEITLHRGMVATMATYLPFRLPFFVSSTFKMVYTIQLDLNSNQNLQFAHSVCFIIFCLTPLGNSILYFLSDRRARFRIANILSRWKDTFHQRLQRYLNRRTNGSSNNTLNNANQP